MRVSNNNIAADNLIQLVACLKTIKTDDIKMTIYAEKMFDKNGKPITY